MMKQSKYTQGLGLVFNALTFSAEAHKRQRRKDSEATPYINHPIEVANLLVACGVTDPITLAAALLHDTVEDCGVTRAQLASRFGEEVANTVMEVTDDKSLPKLRRKRLQITQTRFKSERARQIKLSDKTCNLRDVASNPPKDWDLARRSKYFEHSAAVVNTIRHTSPTLAAQFDAVYKRRLELTA